MRIRQIKPEFWKDAKIASLPEAARLFYIGLWQIADDGGWLRWSVEDIGAELYPFDGRLVRERRIVKYAMALEEIGRLRLATCGAHATIPRMPAHQHLAGSTRRVLTVTEEHRRCRPETVAEEPIPATPRDAPPIPAAVGLVSVSKGSVSKVSRSSPTGRHLERVDGEWRPRVDSE